MRSPRVPGMDIKTIIKFCVSLGLIVWIFHSIDFEEFRVTLTSLPGAFLIYASVLILLQIPILAYRWFCILNAFHEQPEWKMLCKATYVGIFFNQALPGSVGGDLVRIMQLHGNGVSLRNSANSVILERLSGLYALVILMVIISSIVAPMLPDQSLVIPILALLGLVTLGFILLAYADQLVPGWRPFIFIKKALASIRIDYLKVLKSPGTIVYTLILGVIGWSLNLWAIYILGVGIGIDIPLAAFFFFGGLSVLASVLPISMAGWGVREGAMVALFGLMEVPSLHAMSLSVTFGVLMLLTSLPAGILWLRSDERSKQRDLLK